MMARPSSTCSRVMHSGGLAKKLFQRTNVKSPFSLKYFFTNSPAAETADFGGVLAEASVHGVELTDKLLRLIKLRNAH